MPAGPFINGIASTTASGPGTGAFTPNAAAASHISWGDSVWGAPTGWIGLVRYDDGTAWELRYGYWNGTTISRPTDGFVTSSSGTGLSLSSAAIATMVTDGGITNPNLGMGMARGYTGISGATTAPNPFGLAAVTVTGTAGTASVATTNFLTEQPTSRTASATTANAQAGYTTAAACAVNNTTSGRGGWQFVARWGSSTTIPTNQRLFVGVTGTTFVGVTTDPSARTAHYAGFAEDSTDTNIQLLVNNNSGTGTKTDTGIPLAANGWYHTQLWQRPGGTRVYGLLIRLDTGAIWFGTTDTDTPGTTTLLGQVIGGLSATTGTAFTMNMSAMMLRAGGW
jgi:hypothetical protein